MQVFFISAHHDAFLLFNMQVRDILQLALREVSQWKKKIMRNGGGFSQFLRN